MCTQYRTGQADPCCRRTLRWLVVIGVLLSAACGSAEAQQHITLHGALLTSAVPQPTVTLTDTSGTPFDLASRTTSGITLLYFGYTHCPDVCPTQMATMAAALKRLPASVANQVTVIFVTTDPDRDTAAVVRAWLDNFSSRFIGLTGDQATIDQAEAQVGIAPEQKEDLGNGNYSVDHAAFVLAYTPDQLAHVAYPLGVSQANWVQDLNTLVKKGWKPS